MSGATGTPSAPAASRGSRPDRPPRRERPRRTSLFAGGEAAVWLTGGSLGIALAMILGLLVLVLARGIGTFWPVPLVRVETVTGAVLLGEVDAVEAYEPSEAVLDELPPEAAEAARRALEETGGVAQRRRLRTENFELTGTHFQWISDFAVADETLPEWALVVERLTSGRFYGTPAGFLLDGEERESGPAEAWRFYLEHREAVRRRWEDRRELETHAVGRVNARLEAARLELRRVELEHGAGSPEHEAARARYEPMEAQAHREYERIRSEIEAIDRSNDRFQLVLETGDGVRTSVPLDEIVRAYPANRLSVAGRVAVYLSRWWEFLSDDPRGDNSEGGVMPAIFGTVTMTLIMCVLVLPFGVLAALYLREYARAGPVVSTVRIAINNLAGVPSIVFGVFGLGFFCYIVGANIDELLFEARLPNPTYGKGGLLWASLTLALLTLPVVIVPTEEALAAVPGSMREGSYACGATRWQTIRRIVLPKALPGIMTGAILAIARGAGEVAPLMLVGAVKLAHELPVDAQPPFVHPERSFMHLGFHIYDLGFQSQNSEAAKPMVFTTTLLLIALVVLLNLLAIWLRARLRRRYQGTHV